jgi:peptidoglycan-associated lipoprotein
MLNDVLNDDEDDDMKSHHTMPAKSLRLHGALLVALASAWFAGCSSVPLNSDVPVESRTPTPVEATSAGVNGASSSGTSQSGVTPVDLTGGVDASKLTRTIYFDYDSFVVKDDYSAMLGSYAKLLGADRKKRLQVEGHTDERGGSEYNLALGQKRADAVVKSLTLLGVTEAQVEAVSFGKERPAVQGSNEAAYAKNRRAELNLK